MKIAFYSGEDCHLCELAFDLIEQLENGADLDLETFDIKSDHHLYHLYALRIPVLKRLDTNDELGWPFDIEQLREFLR